MKNVAADRWIPSDGIVLEEKANAIVRTSCNTLVSAGPGAGKTELLAQRASYLFQTNTCRDPQKILAISFKNDAADNLKKRVIERCGNEIENRFSSMTYDAFAKWIVDHFLFALPDELMLNANYLVNDEDSIAAAFKLVGFRNTQNLSSYKLKKYYEAILESIELPFKHDGLGEKVWKVLMKGRDNVKPTLSFKMICMLAEFIVRTNPKIKRGLRITYGFVFLDEFQDTTNLQYNLVKQCFMNSNTVMTAVGDNKQRIMVWAGARKTVFEDYRTEFNAEMQSLVMNHRSAPRLVDLQRRMYASLNENDRMVTVSDKWEPNDGNITLFISDDEYREAVAIAQSIQEHLLQGLKPNELCILCKQKVQVYTKKIIEELAKSGVCARIEDNYQNLLKEPIVEIMVSILRLAINRRRPHDWETIVTATTSIWNIASVQSNDDYYEMLDAIGQEIDQLTSMMCKISSKDDCKNLVRHIVQFWGIKRIKAAFPSYSQGKYLKDQLNKFLDYIWLELENVQVDWQRALENFEGLHSVPIMTIHKSKGLEYEAVYFIGLEDSAFWNFKNQPEEDRCAFFVALSRAKKELFFSFCRKRNNQPQYHQNINEFFDLLQSPGVASIVELRSDIS